MSNTEDKLSKQERQSLEYLRINAKYYTHPNSFLSTVQELLRIIDNLAPKPVELVPGNIAAADMLTREDAVYSLNGIKYKFDKKLNNFRIMTNSVWFSMECSFYYEDSYIKER